VADNKLAQAMRGSHSLFGLFIGLCNSAQVYLSFRDRRLADELGLIGFAHFLLCH
jgi:hypothetical protein